MILRLVFLVVFPCVVFVVVVVVVVGFGVVVVRKETPHDREKVSVDEGGVENPVRFL